MHGHTLAPGVMNHAGTTALLGRVLAALPSAALKAAAVVAVDVPLGLIALLGVLAAVLAIASLRAPAKAKED